MNAPDPHVIAAGSEAAAAPGAGASLGGLAFDNSYARLPPEFHTRLDPTPLPDPYLVAASPSVASLIGLAPEAIGDPAFTEAFAGNRQLPGAEPLAAVYSGHQFGVWAGQLGDGRAILLGEVDAPSGRWELQLKGSGRTPYSRMGDGRAVLRSSIREFLCSEALHHLGIPTTRALSVVGSDAPVLRETMETAAVVTRVSPSFVRFGSFEHFYAARREASLRTLADHVIERHYPALAAREERYVALLEEVAVRTARLIAAWQSVGFCHGVMNTDNMSILGLTIDYGPFGFLDAYDAHHVCNHSDDAGRYSYAMQPRIGEWNCYCLGQALLPLLGSVDAAQSALAAYKPAYAEAFLVRMCAKLGLSAPQDGDEVLITRLFDALQANRVDFTRFFRALSSVRRDGPQGDAGCRDLFIDRAAFDAWASMYRARLQAEPRGDEARRVAMNAVNPKYVLRNHLAEVAIRLARGGDERERLARHVPGLASAGRLAPAERRAAGLPEGGQDFSEVARLLEVLSRPFDEQPEHERYAALPPDWASGIEVSCSS